VNCRNVKGKTYLYCCRALTHLVKSPAPINRMKFVISTKKIVKAKAMCEQPVRDIEMVGLTGATSERINQRPAYESAY